jgi:hypothetical protein
MIRKEAMVGRGEGFSPYPNMRKWLRIKGLELRWCCIPDKLGIIFGL